jgi:hypothetical protein
MLSNRRVALLLIASLFLTANTVYAGGGGGGGTKRSSQIIFVDDSTTGIAVTTDTTNTLIGEVLGEAPTIQTADWLGAGGKFASTSGAQAKFSVAAGTYSNIGVTDQGFTTLPMTAPSAPVVLGAGQTIYIVVTGSVGSLVLTVQATAPAPVTTTPVVTTSHIQH